MGTMAPMATTQLAQVWLLGGTLITLLSVCLWAAVLLVATSSHLSMVVGSWLLAHGVEVGKMREARRLKAEEYLVNAQRVVAGESR